MTYFRQPLREKFESWLILNNHIKIFKKKKLLPEKKLKLQEKVFQCKRVINLLKKIKIRAMKFDKMKKVIIFCFSENDLFTKASTDELLR